MLNHSLLVTVDTYKQPVKTSSHLVWSLFDTLMEDILLPFLTLQQMKFCFFFKYSEI